jgi:hypothetical protein
MQWVGPAGRESLIVANCVRQARHTQREYIRNFSMSVFKGFAWSKSFSFAVCTMKVFFTLAPPSKQTACHKQMNDTLDFVSNNSLIYKALI